MVYLSDDIMGFDLDKALGEISEQRRQQALRFKYEQGVRCCVLAYRLLQQGLQQEYGITEPPVFAYGPHGKPSIVGHPEIFFNMSHCREAVICVLGSGPVGVDIESIRTYRPSLARYTMNEEELRQMEAAAHPERMFIRLWTMKEARLKLSGESISRDMKTVLTDTGCHFLTVEQPRYIYTVCADFALPADWASPVMQGGSAL